MTLWIVNKRYDNNDNIYYDVDPYSLKGHLYCCWKWFWTPHFGNKKWLKCKHCDARKHFMPRADCKWSIIDWPKERNNGKEEN